MNLNYTTQFKKDYKRLKKQNKDLSTLRAVIEKLVEGQLLEPKFKNHQLSGNWKGHRDCHIESSLILRYITTANRDREGPRGLSPPTPRPFG